MSNIKSNIDECGLISNTIAKGMGMDIISVLAEKIDNSLDAGSSKINVTIDNLKLKYNLNGQNKEIEGDVLIISDDGKGMSQHDGSLLSLISLFRTNENESGNGIYGIGSIASDLAIGYQENNFDGKLTLYFTKSEEIDQDYEVVIPWFNILKNTSEKNVWSSKISSNNISNTNLKIFNVFRINERSGTTVINFFNDSSLKNFNIKELSYFVKKTYYSYLKTGVKIVIKNNITEKEEVCNNNNLIDFLSLDLVKNDKSKGSYVECKVDAYCEKDSDKYGFKVDIVKYSLGKTNIKFKNQTLKAIAKDQNPTYLSTNDTFENYVHMGTYDFVITLVGTDIINQDSGIMRDHLGKSDASQYTGLVVKRNNRILASPTRLEFNRTTQDGTHWRACLSWNSNKMLDSLIKPQLNKSQLNTDDFNKTLYRTLSLVLKQFYRPFYNQTFVDKINIKDWVYTKKNSKKVSKKNPTKVTDPSPSFEKSSKKSSKKKSITISNVKIRKSFNLTQENEVLLKQSSKCNLLDVKLDGAFMPYDRDHIDNDSSNNSTDNLQLISIIAHRLKTNYYENNKKEGYELMTKDPGFFIANMINNLSKSKHFIRYMNSKKVSINTNHSSLINGLLNLNEKNYDV